LRRRVARPIRSIPPSSFLLFNSYFAAADTAGTRDGVAYQALNRADRQSGQRNLPEGLFVLLEIKKSASVMPSFAICQFLVPNPFR
jgi:hypothetical protein